MSLWYGLRLFNSIDWFYIFHLILYHSHFFISLMYNRRRLIFLLFSRLDFFNRLKTFSGLNPFNCCHIRFFFVFILRSLKGSFWLHLVLEHPAVIALFGRTRFSVRVFRLKSMFDLIFNRLWGSRRPQRRSNTLLTILLDLLLRLLWLIFLTIVFFVVIVFIFSVIWVWGRKRHPLLV